MRKAFTFITLLGLGIHAQASEWAEHSEASLYEGKQGGYVVRVPIDTDASEDLGKKAIFVFCDSIAKGEQGLHVLVGAEGAQLKPEKSPGFRGLVTLRAKFKGLSNWTLWTNPAPTMSAVEIKQIDAEGFIREMMTRRPSEYSLG